MGPRRVKNRGPGDTGGVNGAAYVLIFVSFSASQCVFGSMKYLIKSFFKVDETRLSGCDGPMVSASDSQPQECGFESRVSQLAHQKTFRAGYG